MKLLTLLYVFCLFYVFIPGNVFKLPIKTSKMNIILIHALLFSVILSCTYGLVENVRVLEGMSGADENDEYVKKTTQKIQERPQEQVMMDNKKRKVLQQQMMENKKRNA